MGEENAARTLVGETSDAVESSGVISASRTSGPLTDNGDSARSRPPPPDRVQGRSKRSAVRAEWRNGLFNASFEDDLAAGGGGFLSLLFPADVDAPPAATTSACGGETAGSTSGDGGGLSTTKKESSGSAANERSRLTASAAPTYGGRLQPTDDHLADVSPAGSATGAPTRDTRPLIPDENDRLTDESSLRIMGEVLLPFLMAGIGCVFAGVVLDAVMVRIFVTVEFSRYC